MFPCARGVPVEAAVQPPLVLWRRRLAAAVLKFSQATSRLAGPLQPPSFTSRARAAKLRERSRAASAPSLNTQPSTLNSVRERSLAGFTLLELLIVMGIIAILMVLVAPAFTNLKSAGDVTGAAYTIKGVLDQARTYAMANNTYTWVGFFEENVASTTPGTAGIGRIVISVVASKDGTMIYDPSSPAKITTTQLIQVGKLTKIENAHLWTHTDTPSTPTGSTFDTRPNVASTYCIGNTSPPNSTTPFQYPVGNPEPAAQYTFVKAVQFGPRGEARIDNNSYSLQTAAEIGLEPTHGNTAPSSIPANVVAIQVAGVGGNVKIYRR